MEKIKTGNGWPFDITKKDLIIEPVRGSGPGGQHRNKSYTGIRLTHIPTGTSSRSDESRSQKQNLKTAFRKLANELIPQMKQLISKELRKERYSGGMEKIRTYNEPQQRVTDNRLKENFNYDNVLHGDDLDKIITELVKNRKDET